MAWFDETCINSDNIDMNDCRRINCVAPLHCTCMEGTVIDMIGGCNLDHLKMNHKTSPLGFLGFMYLLFWPSKHISLNVPSALLKSLHKATIFNIFTFYIGSFYIGKGEKENPPPQLYEGFMACNFIVPVHSHGSHQSFSDTAVVMGSRYTQFQYTVLENTTWLMTFFKHHCCYIMQRAHKSK